MGLRLLLAFLLGLPVCLEAATVNAASASYDDVNSAVSSALTGDTVVVPSGSVTWTTGLLIAKRIHLIGAGIGNTVITSGLGSSDFLITYTPSDATSSDFFRLSGFTLDSNNSSGLLEVYRDSSTATRVRIDHNRFIAGTTNLLPFRMYGVIYGVVDHNTFDNAAHIDNYGLPPVGGVTSWESFSFTPGTEEDLYYEDNAFNLCFTGDSGGHGGRYAKRYNTYTLQDPTVCYGKSNGFYPLLDAHGNQLSSVYASMGIEVYGNKIVSAYNVQPFVDLRGGKGLVFFNKVISSASTNMRVREECDDAISPPATATDGTPQHVNHTYEWNNRQDASGSTLFDFTNSGTTGYVSVCPDNEGTALVENTDYWNFTASFDGTAGVGCGTFAARPATCTAGVGYWATTQACDAISDSNVGIDVTVPLQGTLYTCDVGGNAWNAYYTPYVYPHPFQNSQGARRGHGLRR